MQLRRGLAVASQRLWLQQASDSSSGAMSELHREVAAALTALGKICRPCCVCMWQSPYK